MCRRDTSRIAAAALVLAAWAPYADAQTARAPAWRRVGGAAIERGLAGLATGPVDAVWFSPEGATLYARTQSGLVFATADGEAWSPGASPAAAEPNRNAPAAAQRLPEENARTVADPSVAGRMYALGRNLYVSDDGGRSWNNLSAYGPDSVIGPGQRGVAVSPRDPEHIAIANDSGVWVSRDGGMSWAGLNDELPALAARRILATPEGLRPARLLTAGGGSLELDPGSRTWIPGNAPAGGTALGETLVQTEGSYGVTAAGRLLATTDGRWSPVTAPGPVERIFASAARPALILAVSGGRLYRTINGGQFWDDLTASLRGVNGVAASLEAGAVYAATGAGVFLARVDLERASPAAPGWAKLEGLPAAAAMDVALQGQQLFAALDGYGLYAAVAPHRLAAPRLVHAADLLAVGGAGGRPAAPGSLLSVLGARVESARAGSWNSPVLAASEDASQIQIPFEASGSSLTLAVGSAAGQFAFPIPLQTSAPAVFAGSDGEPILLDADTGLMLDARNPARSGARVQVLATGLGRVRPDWPTGMAAPLQDPPAVAAPVRVWVDKSPAAVTRAVLAPGYVGMYLVEFQLPSLVNAGPAELYLSAGGAESNRVRIYLEP